MCYNYGITAFKVDGALEKSILDDYAEKNP